MIFFGIVSRLCVHFVDKKSHLCRLFKIVVVVETSAGVKKSITFAKLLRFTFLVLFQLCFKNLTTISLVLSIATSMPNILILPLITIQPSLHNNWINTFTGEVKRWTFLTFYQSNKEKMREYVNENMKNHPIVCSKTKSCWKMSRISAYIALHAR